MEFRGRSTRFHEVSEAFQKYSWGFKNFPGCSTVYFPLSFRWFLRRSRDFKWCQGHSRELNGVPGGYRSVSWQLRKLESKVFQRILGVLAVFQEFPKAFLGVPGKFRGVPEDPRGVPGVFQDVLNGFQGFPSEIQGFPSGSQRRFQEHSRGSGDPIDIPGMFQEVSGSFRSVLRSFRDVSEFSSGFQGFREYSIGFQ